MRRRTTSITQLKVDRAATEHTVGSVLTHESARPHAHRATRSALRRALAVMALVAAIIAFNPFGNRTIAPARVIVEPASVTITAPAPTTSAAPNDEPCDSVVPVGVAAVGENSAAAALTLHVRVLPGKAQWLADTDPVIVSNGDTRILSGKVLYAIGDNHAWKLMAHITGADGHAVIPQCLSAYLSIPGDTSTVITGDRVTVGDAPIVVCEGTPGHSGGIFAAALDLDGRVSGDITVTVELII